MESVAPAALDDPQLITRLRLRDLMMTQQQVLSAMICSETAPGPGVLYTCGGRSAYRPARPIPQRDLWFERVWKQYREREASNNQ